MNSEHTCGFFDRSPFWLCDDRGRSHSLLSLTLSTLYDFVCDSKKQSSQILERPGMRNIEIDLDIQQDTTNKWIISDASGLPHNKEREYQA